MLFRLFSNPWFLPYRPLGGTEGGSRDPNRHPSTRPRPEQDILDAGEPGVSSQRFQDSLTVEPGELEEKRRGSHLHRQHAPRALHHPGLARDLLSDDLLPELIDPLLIRPFG